MARPKAKAPTLRSHLSGQSVVTLDGRDFYLGKHDSPESLARYAVLIGIYQAGGLKLPEDFDAELLDAKASFLAPPAPQPSQQAKQTLLVRHVTASYREHITSKYPDEVFRMTKLLDDIDKHEGDTPADDYGPLALQRQRWIDAGNARVYCNRLNNAVVRMFKYAVSQELVKSETWQRLKSVEPLRIGRTSGRKRLRLVRQLRPYVWWIREHTAAPVELDSGHLPRSQHRRIRLPRLFETSAVTLLNALV